MQTSVNQNGQPSGREGQIAYADPGTFVASGWNAEASASLLIGKAAKVDTTEKSGRSIKALASTGDAVSGVVTSGESYAPGTTGDIDAAGTGIKPGGKVNLLVCGPVLVKVEEAVYPEDRGFCRVVADGSEEIGAWRKSSDSSDCIDCSKQTKFLTGAGAGELAVLWVDFRNKP